MPVLDPAKTINGTFGVIFHEGKWLNNVKKSEAKVDIDKQEVKVAGTRWVGFKSTNLTGKGTLTLFKTTSEWLLAIGKIADDTSAPFVTELISKLEDPEVVGAERIRYKGVQFDTIQLANFAPGEIAEEELPFTFTGYELLDSLGNVIQ